MQNKDAVIQEMIDLGVINKIDNSSGETVFHFDWDRLERYDKTLFDAFRAAQQEEFEEAAQHLVDLGLMSMSFEETDTGLEAVYFATEKGKAYAAAMAKE